MDHSFNYGFTSLGSVETKAVGFSKSAEHTPVVGTEHSRSRPVFFPKSTAGFSMEHSQVFQKDRGVRSLLRTEWEERRKKGLCYKFGQSFSPTHKCPEGQLRVLLLGDDESDASEGLHFQLESRDTVHSDGVIQKLVEPPIKPCGQVLVYGGSIDKIMS
ncbi:hypothetical protein E3N88_42449 [Mikania micrantha]|uniref:Uncharacterized protein n=1 Tax=Mikania micrantha TaxID=192012 RepID=A0A5N6LHV3_9ASTR|nr:hypothetical protein E3N88_42449 [Mikania micrantha]